MTRPCGKIDGGHGGSGEGQQDLGLARPRDLQDVAGAMVEHGLHLADFGAAGVEYRQTDEIGVVELILGQVRQPVARGVEPGALQRLGGLAGRNAGQLRCEGA